VRAIAFVLGVVGAVVGLWAAWEWFRASRVDAAPIWANDMEPKVTELAYAGWIAGMLQAGLESSRFNQRAAALTAIAVALGSASSLVGLFA